MRTLISRFHAWLPSSVDTRVRVLAIASLVVNIVIVGTGGAVRLTGSGLGCPTWPYCTADSFVPTAEMGIHGVIEFANRTLTGVLVIVALAMALSVLKIRKSRPELFRLSIAIGVGIILQAVIGGVTVWTAVNPWVVGLHFVLSCALVVLATVLVWRVYDGQRAAGYAAPTPLRILTHITSLALAITVVAGVLTTGSGPHAGDSGAARNGLNPEFMQHLHSWPAYVALGGTMLVLVWALVIRSSRTARWAGILLVIEIAQIVVGITQARLGLPPLLVGIHMVLAVIAVGGLTAVVLSLRPRSVINPSVENARETVAA